ncbi:putative bifunctional diguanylate cyclase/phosphodiesterase [uncultured Enterovirga sp.]|uniref:putative bifunctional diguanylate cyclase/phosphodiesterase n=1 Tax=uncultured Enterovirga sp. TaxID=2026352 RepID=UPI0035CA5B5E
MSIRYKVLMGCLSLTLLTVILGGITRESQRALGDVALRIYDQALMALSYLRASQNGLVNLRATIQQHEADAIAAGSAVGSIDHSKAIASALPAIRDDLEVARTRAMSPSGGEATTKLAAELDEMGRGTGKDTRAVLAKLQQFQLEFDTAVEIYAGDGFRYRRSAVQMVEQTLRNAAIAIAASVVVALLITFFLSRSIVPALCEAVSLAQAIAAGKLDNRITPRGGGEPSQLLGALATMQRSISDNLDRIKALMADQTASHANQMGEQNARFEAALNNMSQGLCMFDEEQRLSICNHRFVELFGEPVAGVAASCVLGAGVAAPLSATERLSIHDLPDGRIIAVSSEPMAGGGWVSTYEDVTERRRVEERLSYMARHDALTGLPNRTLFREHMELLGLRNARPAVLCLDIDRFKNVNDTLGHPIGDGLLREVAERLGAAAGPDDLLVRLGGDEFALVRADYHGPEEVATLAAEIVESMSRVFEIEGHQIVVSVSVGVALGETATHDADRLLKSADMALYRAKAEGRSTFRFFEADMDARLQARRSLELDLRAALGLNQFELFYQPLVLTQSGEIAGFEALLRWRHPERGLVPPLTFIPLAEEMGIIEEIGAWVIETACAEAMSWADDIKVAVNLSPIQFRNRFLASQVAGCLARTGLAPHRLELEITESVLLNDSDSVLTILNELKLLGVGISMDDFGTGFSSLSYLHKFPFDKIKIDQCFVRGLFESDGLAIVRAVIGLGRSLNLEVIAEGVETAEQLRALRDEGCLQAQGYHFSKPVPASEAKDLLAGRLAAQSPQQTFVALSSAA